MSSYRLTNKWVVTFRYPLEPLEPPKELRGKPDIDPAKCIGCGACVRACPPNALSEEVDLRAGVKRIKLFYGRCIFCGRCWEVCPEGAIRLTNEFELATPNKEDLHLVVELPLQRCSVCGRPTEFTERQVARAVSLAEGLPPEAREEVARRATMCRDCRASLFREVLEKRGWGPYARSSAKA